MSYLACIKSDDGITLFSRGSINDNKLPLGLETSLNTLFSFGNKHDAKVHSADSQNCKITWKIYHSNITLILIDEIMPVDERVYFDKIDLLFDALVLMYGLDDLIKINNVEKFKKEIRITYNILDTILDPNPRFDLFGGFLTGCFDSIIVNDLNFFQSKLNESLVTINTSYGALFLNGRLAAASKAWWELNPKESFLISILILTSSYANSRDVPIYLPHKNPHQALRLLTFNLISNNMILCFICSEKPSVDFVERHLSKSWNVMYQSLVNLKQYMPRNLHPSLNFDKNMIGFLLINKKIKCCFSSLMPSEQSATQKSAGKIYEILKKCYLNISTNFFRKYFNQSLKLSENDYDETTLTSSPEAYTLVDDFKCFALNETDFEFYALFNSAIPVYAIREVTKMAYLHILSK